MNRVVITGATSMIGIALIEECLKNKCEILAIVRENSKNIVRLPKLDKLKVLECNLDKLSNIELSDRYDVLYHLGWSNTDKIGRNDSYLQEPNIKFTLDAVNLANKLGCKKFIGAGSQAEFGVQFGVITEDTVCKPVTAYGISKYASCLLANNLCKDYGIKFIWGRIFSVYGKNDNPDTMINYAINCLSNNIQPEFNDVNNIWNYLYEKDAGKIFYQLGHQEVANGVYCIANKESALLKDYINVINEKVNPNVKCILHDNKSQNLNVDISKLLNAIKFSDFTTFENGIKKIIG